MSKKEKKEVIEWLLSEIKRVSMAAIDNGMEEADPVTQIVMIAQYIRQEREAVKQTPTMH